jgi:SsrA-binding protein
VALLGTEVKSIREGRVNLRDSYAQVKRGEVFVHNVHIQPYSHRGYADHEPMRDAKAAAAPPRDPQADGKTVERA